MDDILCKEITDKLKSLSDSNTFDEESFMKLITKVNSILKSSAKTDASDLSAKENAALSSILILMTEACRHSLDATQLENLLKDHSFSNKRTDLLIKLYESIKTTTTVELDSLGSHLPHIVGANWSLDYCIKDSGSERVNALEFLVDLETQGIEGKEGSLQFSCSLEEMQDLVAQLKDAAKHVDKLASG